MKGLRLMGFALLLAGLAACGSEEQAAAPEVPIRAIKHMTIGEVAATEVRVLAGIVGAGTSSNVAFEIGGQVTEMLVNVGDTIEPGQLLARLDPERYRLEVEQAEFTLRQAEAAQRDSLAKFKQQEELRAGRYTTQTALDTAQNNLRNAEGQVGIAQSQLVLRRRDLAKTELVAPFGGRVAEQVVEVFEEVGPGQAIYLLQTEGDDEVSVSVPERLISKVTVGQRLEVRFPPLDGAAASGVISEISPRAGDGNAYPAKIKIVEAPSGLRPGMSARIILSYETGATGEAFTVPIGALKGSASGTSEAVVYLYDADAGVVRERPVKVVGVEGNTPQIVGELKPGDVIATAGVGHMFDGMEVRLLDPAEAF